MKRSKMPSSREETGSQRARGLIETLVVIALILIIPLFFAIKSGAKRQVAPGTAAHAAPTAAEARESSATLKAKRPSQCTFPLAETTAKEPTPDEYTFSEPQVVLTAPKGNIYHIAEWLPDNQQVLMTEALRNRNTPANQINPESIELFNPVTGIVKIYATRPETHEPPSWYSELNAVVYPVMDYFDIDNAKHTYNFDRQLWVSYGNPDTAQMLDDNLSQLPIAVKPGASEAVYFSDKQVSKLNSALKKMPSSPFDPSLRDYANSRRDKSPILFKMVWQPETSLIFLYSKSLGGGGYTFVLNADTGKVCELNLGGATIAAHWSSDGRYLALGLSTVSHPAQLAVLNIVTGNLTLISGAPQGVSGRLFINDFIWAPDYRHLLAIGSVTASQSSRITNNAQGLYLVDIESGQSVHVAKYASVVSSEDNNWAWSSDGSKLLLRCPTHEVDQICLISVHQTEK